MMIMRNAGEKRLQNFVTTFCALFFALFSFTFVAVYKSPLLQIVYDNVATGRLEYDGWVVSGILTAILVGLALWMNRFAKFQREWTAMAFLPSAFILAFVTDIDRSIFTGEKSYAVWGWVLLISLFLYLFLSFVLHRVLFEKIKNPTMVANRIVWRNLILFVLLFAGVGALSGGDRSFMCEAIQYCLFKEGNVDEAVLVGKHYTSASQELTAQSAFLLSLKGELGDKIFEYPNNFGAEGLLPSVKQSSPIASDTIYAHIGFERERGETALNYLVRAAGDDSSQLTAREYYLVALLAECRLVDFVDKVFEYYNMGDYVDMPKHYKEALLLYSYVVQDSGLPDADAAMLSSFEALVKELKKSGSAIFDDMRCYSQYGSTYWWYYLSLTPVSF